MRLLFVVHRYGREVRGGAEQACRDIATRLAARGHEVTVLTTRALRYTDWAAHYPAGTEVLDGVEVVRLDNDERDLDAFERLNHRLTRAEDPVALPLQQAWLDAQGPHVPGLEPWLAEHAADFDVALFFPYLYATTTDGLRGAAGRVPTVLVPCLHPEPPLRLHAFDRSADLADLVVFLSPEEADLYARRFRTRPTSVVAGLGTDLDPPRADVGRLAALGLGDRPFAAYVGRLDPSKGSTWLADRFADHRTRFDRTMDLAMVGDPIVRPADAAGIVVTGPVDDPTRTLVLEESLALVQPSPYESFSMVLMEAWAVGTPAIAFRGNPVLRGHVTRSGGGLLFSDAAELAAALDLLAARPDLALELGAAGRAHVVATYPWERVLDRWEQALRRAAALVTTARR